MRSLLRSRRAFTLIELLIVILVVAILIAVALPAFLGQTSKAEDSVAQQRLDTAQIEAKAAWTSGGQSGFSQSLSALLGQLRSSEPSMTFIDGSSGASALTSAGPVEVWFPTSGQPNSTVAMCTDSASGNAFCFTANESSGSLTANADAPAAAPAKAAAVSSVFAPAQASAGTLDIGTTTQIVYVGGTSPAAAYCVTNAIGQGVAVSSACSAVPASSYQYSPTSWPTIRSSATPSSRLLNLSRPAVSGTVALGASLSASPGTWSGSSSQVLSYQWQDCATAVGSCQNITGATGSAYTVGPPDTGYYIRVAVTDTDQGLSATAYSPISSTSSGTVGAYATTLNADAPQWNYHLQDQGTTSGADSSANNVSGSYSTSSGEGDSTAPFLPDTVAYNTSASGATFTAGNKLPVASTYIVWFKTTSTGSSTLINNGTFYCNTGPNQYTMNALQVTMSGGQISTNQGGCLQGGGYGAADGIGFTAPGTYNDGRWHMLAVAQSTTTEYLYIDGTLEGSANTYFSSYGKWDPFGVGSQNPTFGSRLAGDIAEVSGIPTQLSTAQIAALYQAS